MFVDTGIRFGRELKIWARDGFRVGYDAMHKYMLMLGATVDCIWFSVMLGLLIGWSKGDPLYVLVM